jgi:preprotein translocase subunit SecA
LSFVESILRRSTNRDRRVASKHVHDCRKLALGLEKSSDAELKARSLEMRERHDGSDGLDIDSACQLTALAIVSVQRAFGFAPHDVQIIAAIESALGKIVEMKTGEGKTIVAGMTAYLLSVLGRGVHVATTNDYLAQRDHDELSPFFDRLGVRVGMLQKPGNDRNNRLACECDVTYGPGYQFGFDFLMDQVTLRRQQQSLFGNSIINTLNDFDPMTLLIQQQGHGCTVVDEADSVLIDEATTPLVLSGGTPERVDPRPYLLARQLAESFVDQTDYRVTPSQQILLKPVGRAKTLDAFDRTTSLALDRPWQSYVENALRAKLFFRRDEHYVVREGKVRIVDQFTGRIFDDRTWQNGLHQAVEAKEDLIIYSSTPSRARITRQRYFQKYHLLCGMTGTAWEVKREFEAVYQCGVVPIPTRLPCRRTILKAQFFIDWESKLQAIASDVVTRHRTGQPILIGTRTIRESQRVEEALRRVNLWPVVLNGVQDSDEAEIIAAAGMVGSITVATNMAGRGTDIKLDQVAKEAGGLHVLATEPHSSARIDQQLIGRCARQGDVGSAQFFISAEDDFLVKKAPELADTISRSCDASGHSHRDFSEDVHCAQTEEEAAQFYMRQQLVLQDNWFDEVRKSVSSHD